MAFGDISPRIEQAPRFNQQTNNILNQLLRSSMGQLQNLQGQGNGFEPFAQRARSQFETKTIPGIAERFTAMGGGQRSSAFQDALGTASAGLEEGLAQLGSQFNLNQQDRLLQQLQLGLTPQFENLYAAGQGGFGTNLGNTLLELLPMLIGTYFGGPIGGAAGNAAGSGLSSLLSQFGGNQ